MASGDLLGQWNGWSGLPFGTSYIHPRMQTEAGGNSERFQVMKWAESGTFYTTYWGIMPSIYEGNGIDCTLVFTHANNSDTVNWNVGIHRYEDTVDDISGGPPAIIATSINDTLPTSGNLAYWTGSLSSSSRDGVTAGDLFSMLVYRNSLAAASSLFGVYLKET